MLLVEMKNNATTSDNRLEAAQNVRVVICPSNAMAKGVPKRLKAYVYTKTCTQIFTVALFIMAKKGKQPKCW